MPDPTFFTRAVEAFQTRLCESAKERVSRKTTQINRRLDSLARLLEQNLICTAVTYDHENKKILISCNKISEKQDNPTKDFERIKSVITLLANHKASVMQVINGLAEIIALNFCQEERYLYNAYCKKTGNNKEKIKQIIAQFLLDMLCSGQSTQKWRNQITGTLWYQQLKKNEKIDDDYFLKKMLDKITRITRDFIKLRKLIFSVTHDPNESMIQTALRGEHTEIIKEEDPGVHAEMRIINKLKKLNATPNNYIGISKLCCDKCGLAVDVMQVEVRGKHGQGYGWPLPKFIKDDMTMLKNYISDRVYEFYEKLEQPEKQAFLAHIQSEESAAYPNQNAKQGRHKHADASSNDGEFGVSDNDRELYHNAEKFPFHLIWALKEIKCKCPSRLNNLLYAGFELKEAVLLYVTEEKKFMDISRSKDKACAMSQKNAIKLMRKDDDNDYLLSQIYDISPELFKFIIEDKDNLLDTYSIEEIRDKYCSVVADYASHFSDDEYPFEKNQTIFNNIIHDLQKEYGYDYSSSSFSDDSAGNGTDESRQTLEDDDYCHAEYDVYEDTDSDEQFEHQFSGLHC